MAAPRILVVDDSELIRKVARMSLEKIGGWEVLTAESGAEGVAQAEAGLPDAVLLDVVLPDMDGPAVFQELQSKPSTRGIPVVFLTGKEGAGEVEMLRALGSKGVIPKPFDPASLPSQVAAMVGWSTS